MVQPVQGRHAEDRVKRRPIARRRGAELASGCTFRAVMSGNQWANYGGPSSLASTALSSLYRWQLGRLGFA